MTLMTGLEEYGELASGSLPPVGGDPLLQPSWTRSLQELVAANQALIGGTSQQPTAAARLLIGERTDIGSLASSLEPPKAPKKEAFTGIVEARTQHRNNAIEGILLREMKQTQKSQEVMLERQLEEDWTREREWWMNELVGTRNLVDKSNGATMNRGRPSDRSVKALPGPSHTNLIDSRGSSNTPLNPQMVHRHLELVRAWKRDTNLSAVFLSFRGLASAHSNGYATAWEMFSSMIPMLSSPINGAVGSLLHFCRQYQVGIKGRVSAANAAGQDVTTAYNFGDTMAGTIASYVKLEHGSNASVWTILYYCLRCGDAVSAKNVLMATDTANSNFPEQPIIFQVVNEMSMKQGAASCIWEVGNPVLPKRESGSITDLHEKALNLEPDNTHKIGVLALLRGELLKSFATVEDYLFSRLWTALQSQDPVVEIKSIGESVCRYGPEHFGADESDGWGYVLPLLASQYFRTALAYLTESGGPAGLMQAVHLALVLGFIGKPVDDLGREAYSDCVVTALLVKYASLLETEPNVGPISALEYLSRIPNKDRSLMEIAHLVSRSTNLINQIAGALAEDGSRQPGELDKHLTPEESSKVLCEAGEILRSQGLARQNAEMCATLLMRAGRFDRLLRLLNELISTVDDNDADKTFWHQESDSFDACFLARRSIVVESLERDKEMHLVFTNRTLRKLRKFCEGVKKEQVDESLALLEELQLVPLRQELIDEANSKFRGLDPTLKAQYPALLVHAMKCLYGIHRRVKSEARGVNDTVATRLSELQFKARYIYIFAGLIGMPSSVKEDIQRMRNNMV